MHWWIKRPTRFRWHESYLIAWSWKKRLVSLDALHTQDETARALVLEHGADYLLTVKGNQPTVREQIETLVAVPQGDFPPS